MKNLTHQFPLSKTLRFELIPQGRTLEFIQKNGLLSEDEQRAIKYQEVKKLIDNYHRTFIDAALIGLHFNDISRYEELYFLPNKNDEEKAALKELQRMMRSKVAARFSKNPSKEITERFQNIFKKELIKNDLPEYLDNDEEKKTVAEFDSFTTYFSGFYTNRANMYSADEKSTAISYRIVHENLPKFLSNKRVFEKLKKNYPELIIEAIKEVQPILQGVELESMFKVEYFNQCYRQCEIEFYNLMIGGRREENSSPVRGFNQIINLYRQKHKLKKTDIPNLTVLYKQILSEKESMSWLPDQFENDQEVLESIESFYQSELLNFETGTENINVFAQIKKHFAELNSFDLSRIFVRNDLSLTQISQLIFRDWSLIKTSLEVKYEQDYPNWEKTKKEIEEKEKFLKKAFFSIEEIQDALDFYVITNEELKSFAGKSILCEYFQSFLGSEKEGVPDFFANISERYESITNLLNSDYPSDENLATDEVSIEKIKNFLDALLGFQQFIKPLNAQRLEAEKDEAFYNDFNLLFDQVSKIIPLYDKVRNYLTRKPYSTKKYKLNFENSTLMDGWDLNKEADNTTVLLRKHGKYFLGIMNKKYNKIFKEYPYDSNGKNFEKIIYKLLPGANKMLPKVFLSNKGIQNFKPSQEIQDNYKRETHKKGALFVKQDCHKLIDFFKKSIKKHEDWLKFGFEFSDTKNYEDLSGFYREVENQGYKITFDDVSEDYINKMVDEGKLYLFKIYNKDFSSYSKGKPNMHTLYWQMLFDEENLKNVVYKLNGQAEVFYRKKSITKNIITHNAHKGIPNKNTLNPKKESTFDYDIIKDKRFTEDKFQFHVPITMNFQSKGNGNINQTVNEYLKNTNDEIKVIGIDRGERHLLYFTLINQNGGIIKQFSLNEIESNNFKTDYHLLLDEKEKGRQAARKSWKTIENIKELKEGYLSQIVHQIAKLIVDHNAIVVLEDLNFGFKRGRFKVEKQVYQKFEKMLIDKLNYLVFKEKNNTEYGGLLNAYQLTNKFESFQKLGKQSGILYYVPAWNTSKIDPETGFVNLFFNKYENLEKAKEFFGKFKSISFNTNENHFEFDFDYGDFTRKAEGSRRNWTVCTYGKRIVSYRNPQKNSEWDYKNVILTEEFQKLFQENGIDISKDLQKQILEKNNADFFKKLMDLYRLTLQMRNSDKNQDYLISPVKNKNGKFYNSEEAKEILPENADANGAYHIAKKGLWVLEQISKTKDLKKLKLAISNEDWLNFVQQ